jgi:CheY-like chemotaxis protein/anti-sigma regulatory factor (Ser/Thr protein kinase)
MAHIETGKLTLNVKPMQFANGMHEIASLFELQAAAKGLAFKFEVQGAMPEWVRADEKRVRQIVINLLGNAIKFTRQGSVTFKLRYAREMAQVEVHDTGPGMQPDELAQIFDPFTRAANVAMGATGSGLGLTIAKMLTDLMGGELTAASQSGQGSVFQVRLFLPELHNQPGQSLERLAPAVRKARNAYTGVRRKILVVDNEETDRELLVNLLEPLGFVLRMAASGHDALDLLASGYDPDVVLLDLAMPGIDGWETLRRIRSLAGHQPQVAIVTANAFERGVDNLLGIAPEDFVVKPVRHTELLDWLERKLGLAWLETLSTSVDSGASGQVTQACLADSGVAPPKADVLALQELVRLGFYRGITNKLDAILAEHPSCASFVETMNVMARKFQFEAMLTQLQIELDTYHAC